MRLRRRFTKKIVGSNGMLRFSLASLLAATVVIAIACAAMLNPNAYFATGLHLVLLATTLASLYLAIFSRGLRQHLAGGWAVFVIGMQLWTGFFGDHRQNNLSDWIVSAVLELQGQQPGFDPYQTGWTSYPARIPSAYYSPPTPTAPTIAPTYSPPQVGPPTVSDIDVSVSVAPATKATDIFSLRMIVDSLLSLLAGGAGMLFALLVQRAEAKRQPVIPPGDR
jgi:hypothetical protein